MAGNEIGITSLGYLYIKVRVTVHLPTDPSALPGGTWHEKHTTHHNNQASHVSSTSNAVKSLRSAHVISQRALNRLRHAKPAPCFFSTNPSVHVCNALRGSRASYGNNSSLGGDWAGPHNCWMCQDWQPVGTRGRLGFWNSYAGKSLLTSTDIALMLHPFFVVLMQFKFVYHKWLSVCTHACIHTSAITHAMYASTYASASPLTAQRNLDDDSSADTVRASMCRMVPFMVIYGATTLVPMHVAKTTYDIFPCMRYMTCEAPISIVLCYVLHQLQSRLSCCLTAYKRPPSLHRLAQPFRSFGIRVSSGRVVSTSTPCRSCPELVYALLSACVSRVWDVLRVFVVSRGLGQVNCASRSPHLTPELEGFRAKRRDTIIAMRALLTYSIFAILCLLTDGYAFPVPNRCACVTCAD